MIKYNTQLIVSLLFTTTVCFISHNKFINKFKTTTTTTTTTTTLQVSKHQSNVLFNPLPDHWNIESKIIFML